MNKLKRKDIQKAKGITLIALVVTIVVLLILATVSLSMLSGENGIMSKASTAKEKSEESNEKEIIDLAVVNAKIQSGFNSVNKKDIDNELDKSLGQDKYESNTVENGIMIKTNRGAYYYIDFNGNVRYLGVLKEGQEVLKTNQNKAPYVYYLSKNGEKILCRVLYNNSEYGLQIITDKPVENVELGKNDLRSSIKWK